MAEFRNSNGVNLQICICKMFLRSSCKLFFCLQKFSVEDADTLEEEPPHLSLSYNIENYYHSSDEDIEEISSSDDDDEPATPETLSQVQWTWCDGRHFTPKPLPPFDNSLSGFKFGNITPSTELDYFFRMFSTDVLDLCVTQSNGHYHRQPHTSARAQNFKPITHSDFLKVIAAKIIMGIDYKPEIKHYWSKEEILGGSIIPTFISYNRFCEITQFLHFDEPQPDNSDRIAKIRNLWEMIFNNFKGLIVPFENLCLDESLILFKGRLYWRQYNPKKAAKFGIKTFSLVDSKTGFILDSRIFSGKSDQRESNMGNFGHGGSMVLDFLRPHFFKSHTVFVDNFFSSPNLAFQLLQKGTKICGTVRKNRKNMPPLAKKLTKGEINIFSSHGILVESVHDKRIVNIISTYTPHRMVSVTSKNTKAIKTKTQTIKDYNTQARGVDVADMMLQPYSILRKTYKW